MFRFKVGDKVRLRECSEFYGMDGQIPVGRFAVVTETNRLNKRFYYEVSWGEDYNQYGEQDLEPHVQSRGNIK